jgi:hypothetical protein
MAAVAVLLGALAPDLPSVAAALVDAQRTVDTAGPDAVVLPAVGLLAWTVWAWGAVGLALTAATAMPGILGSAARVAVTVVLPAGARRAAALTLGIGLGIGAPLMASAAPADPVGTAVVPAAVPDWPATPTDAPDRPVPATAGPGSGAAGVPDWPAPTAGDEHVVLRGDCLWDIAAARLRQQQGAVPTDAAVASAVQAWWTANESVIGPDPDLLLPGQVLRPPSPP